MFFEIFLFILVFQRTKSSLVIDSLSQRGLYVSDYCPKMKYCAEGAHVMCMYYNPNQMMGPRCSNPKNISITPELATKLLDVSNAVRSKIALGKEKGKGGVYLPRGYGIFRLKWDSELATLAQVLANQCVLRHDMCRATKRFSDPGQTAGLVRFSYPDWYPVSKAGHFTTPGLSVPKLFYATTQALKSWYGQKNAVTTHMITTYPDWTVNPNNQGGRLYLEMIYGPATHMGCGISAYTEYAYYDNNAALNYNSVQIICNYSSRPRKDGIVYNTTKPVTPEFSARCGCPSGSIEDDECLCHEADSTPLIPTVKKCSDGNCDPTVVLLPIFTVEDAPSNKLISIPRNNDSATRTHDSMEFIDMFDVPEKHKLVHDLHPNPMDQKYQNIPSFRSYIGNSPVKASKKRILDVKNRHFDQTPHSVLSRYQHAPSFGTLTSPQKKQSIFTRQAKFILPINNNNEHSLNAYNFATKTSVKLQKDVSPRKDFTNAQKLVHDFLGTNKHFDKFKIKNANSNEYKKFLPNDERYYNKKQEQATLTNLHTAEDKVIHFNQVLRNQNSTSVTLKIETADSDRKLMNLLDNLEQEVKNIELHGNKKHIFDAKIRKIYGKLLGEPDNMNLDLFYDSSKEIKTEFNKFTNDFNKNDIINERNVNNHLQDIDYFDVKSHEKHSNFVSRPLSRNQNKINDQRQIISNEDKNRRHEKDIKFRNTDKSELEDGGDRHRYNKFPKRDLKKRRWDNDDPISIERRKYYQNKLERLERRLQNTRTYKRRNGLANDRRVRRMRPTDDYHTRRSASKKQIDSFYMPERARFLHGFR